MSTSRQRVVVEELIAHGKTVQAAGTANGEGTSGKPGGAAHRELRRAFELVPVGDLLLAQAPPIWTVQGLLELGAHVGFVAPPEHAKSLLAMNIAACVATGHDFHGRAVKKGLVVYLCGEGFFGVRRRMQAIEQRHQIGLATAPLVISRTSASLLDPSELARVRAAIEAAQEKYGLALELLVTDTLSRFIAPGKESDAPDMGAFFQVVDFLRRDATGLTLHHPGHTDQTRARGSSSWRAALDTEFTFTKNNDVVTVTCSKMKDAEMPAPLSFRIESAPTMTQTAEGLPVNSAVLVPTGLVPVRKKPSGKNQKKLLAELERLAPGTWTEAELRKIGERLGMKYGTARDAIVGLRQLGYFTDTIGGSRLTHRVAKSEKHL